MAKGSVNGSCSVTSTSDASYTLTCSGSFSFGDWYLYGVRVRCYIDGVQVATNAGYTTGSWQTTAHCSGSKAITRTHEGRNVPWSVTYEDETVNGIGGLGESGSTSGSVWVPAKPSYTVSYNANGGSGAPGSQTKWYNEELTLSSTVPTRTGYTFQGWATTSNATSATYAKGAKYTANSGATLYAVWKVVAPAAPSGVTATRNSDTKNTVTWTRGANADITYSSIKVERRTDGGSWSEIASVSGSATSYADTSTAADHYYQYRVRAYNSTGYSGYATGSTVLYNTPAAPSKVTASRLGETSVSLAIENKARTATALEIQRSTDASSWETVSTVDGTPVTSATDNPGGGTFYYRVRNTRGSLASAWSPASSAVVTITPPNAPTLVSPASGTVINKAEEHVEFIWKHEPIDGSAQTAAELRYSLDNGSSWEVVGVEGNGASYRLRNDFAVNAAVTWGVRTKGAHQDFGPWSGNRTFNVYQEPSVAFALPTDGFVVENTPIAIQLQYDDPSGELVEAVVSASDGFKVVWSRNLGNSLAYEVPSDEWTPGNDAAYYLTAEVRSTSTLTASASRTFTTAFVPPVPADVKVEPNPETGFVNLTVRIGEDAELEPAKHAIVYREYGGERVMLGDRLQQGAGLVDRYAPANVEYSYVVVTVADSGAVSTTYVPARLDTQWFYFIWGESVAKARVNPSGSRKLTRPNRRRRHFAGRPEPVSYDDGSVSDVRSVSFTLREKAEADKFAELMWGPARCVYKSADGEVFHADVETSDRIDWAKATTYGSVTVTVTRIGGGEL